MSAQRLRRSPGTRTALDVLRDWAGRPTSQRYPAGTPALDCLTGGVSVVAWWGLGTGRWRPGRLELRCAPADPLFRWVPRGLRPGPVPFTAADDLRLLDPDVAVPVNASFERDDFRVVELAVGDRRALLAVPRQDLPLLSLALRAR